MTETHTREWKRLWRDDYLKWICGLANAAGGVLEIGRNDDGRAGPVETTQETTLETTEEPAERASEITTDKTSNRTGQNPLGTTARRILDKIGKNPLISAAELAKRAKLAKREVSGADNDQ